MALPRVYRVVQDAQGNIVPQVLGSVLNHGTGVLAQLYNDAAGTQPLTNPMTSDATYGSFKFYVTPGHYDLTFSKPGYTFEPVYDFQVPDDNVTLGTMAMQNADAVAITGGTAVLSELQVPHLGLGTAPLPGISVALQSLYPVGFQVQDFFVGGQAIAYAGLVTFSPTSWNCYMSGTAPNYFAGNIGLNTTNVTSWQLHVNGTIACPGGTVINSTSHAALKRHSRPLEDASALIARLPVWQWEWAADQPELARELPGTQAGFVVEEMAEVKPQWVRTGQDGQTGLATTGLEAYMVATLQEILRRLDALEARA